MYERLRINQAPSFVPSRCARGRALFRTVGPHSLHLNNDISCQGFESLSIWLDYSDGYMAGLAGVDVPYDARFACMYAAEDIASSAVPKFAWWFSLHFY